MSATDICDELFSLFASLTENMTNNHCHMMDSHDHGHSEHGEHGGHNHGGHNHGGCNVKEGEYSIGLHVGAFFILLAASFIGTAIPIAGKYIPILRMNPFVLVLAKCVSTGVVMAVSLLTMINHSLHSFQEECVPASFRDSYDAYALLFAMISGMLMQMLDVLMDVVLEGWAASEGGAAAIEEEEEGVGKGEPRGENLKPTGPCGMIGCGEEPGPYCEMGGCCQKKGANSYGDIGGCCQSRGATAKARLTGARRIAAAVLMEFGLTLHSIFLGLSVGIANDADTKTLLVALTFHQMFEGLALGSRLADAAFNAPLEIVLTLIFSFSVPLGDAIGLIVMKGTHATMTGATFVTLQAVVNAVGGGILLYLGFVLLLVDFPADLRKFAGIKASKPIWKRFAMFLALWVGAAIMTVLAKWH